MGKFTLQAWSQLSQSDKRQLINITITAGSAPAQLAENESIDKISNFSDCTKLKSINILAKITSIEAHAFYKCTSLTSIEIPNSVTSIGASAFEGCGALTSIEIPNSMTSIEAYAFYGCTGLTSIEIPNSVASIGGGAFYGCIGLTSIVIPNSVTSIRSGAFEGCTGLTSIVIPNSVTSIGDGAFEGCTGLTSIVIPNSVTSIGDGALKGCTGLTSIEIPNSVTSIGPSAVTGCNFLLEIFCSQEHFTKMDFPNKKNIIRYDDQEQKNIISSHQLLLFQLHYKNLWSFRFRASLFFDNSQDSKNPPDDTSTALEKIESIKNIAKNKENGRTDTVWEETLSLFKSGRLICIKNMGGNTFEFYLPEGASFKSCDAKSKADKYYSAEEITEFKPSLVSSSMEKSYVQYMRACMDIKSGEEFQLTKPTGDEGYDYALLYDRERHSNRCLIS
ncbi:MAG: hypothetical protein COB66_09280 [Coxiella sp. (in: Bacteria)]|nr:MAG: hypothetical protein COB66_09280 [Coxiella sp. (in: g-proteobacteria)]